MSVHVNESNGKPNRHEVYPHRKPPSLRTVLEILAAIATILATLHLSYPNTAMSLDWTLILAIAGVILGVISAYGNIRRFFLWLTRASQETIREYRETREKEVATIAFKTNFLIAFGFRRIIWTLILFMLADLIWDTASTEPFWIVFEEYAGKALYSAAGGVVGNTLGTLKHVQTLTERAERPSHTLS